MDIDIILNKSDIMPEVYKITGYTGAKNEDMDKISSTEDDVNILDSYFGEAISSIADIISRQGYLSSETEESSTFCFALPTNWNQNLKKALEKSMKQYVSNYVCMQWFNLSKKEEVQYYGTVCDELAVAIIKYLLERERQKRNNKLNI